MDIGRFISVEGGEGVGKSTQITALASALRLKGIDVIVTREPGGTEGAEAVRQLLLSGSESRWGPRAEALLFAAARSDHVERLIRPALSSGKWVISDRFLDSSRAYQGGGSGLTDADILKLHDIGSEGLLTDRTLVLELPPEIAADRVTQRDGASSDRIGGRNSEFHNDVANSFRRYAEHEPHRVRMIDASGNQETVTQRLLAAISDLLL
jgi:dTMP kinase